MRLTRLHGAVVFMIALIATAAAQAGDGAYATGKYPNVLNEQLGIPTAAVRRRIDSTFHKLFYGDDEVERVYYPVGRTRAYVLDVANKDVRTEGMSYGMMIAVQMDRKVEFDRLWTWAKTFMQMREGPHTGYFAWHCNIDGTVLDSTAASDGEIWFVTSLYFASARWGEGSGIYAYRAEADRILGTMLHKEEEPGHGNVTNMFDATTRLVAFVPDAGANMFTDPSYQLPHFYELWARWAQRDNAFWREAAQAARRLLARSAHPKTGLAPDYATFDGRPIDLNNGGHDDFRFDAWRTSMNTAVDALWFGRSQEAIARLNRQLSFFHSQGTGRYGNQFSLDGQRVLGEDHSTGLLAANAVAAMTSTSPYRVEFLREFWNAPIPRGRYRYYDGLLSMLALLQLSGNFQVYDPDAPERSVPR